MRSLAFLILLALSAPSLARADRTEDQLRALVLRDAARRWSCRPAGGAPSPPQVLELIVLGPAHALALVHTDCHSEAEGAYNRLGSVVHVRRGHVELAPFAPRPAWAPGGLADRELLWNPVLERASGAVTLTTGLLFRAIGDSGWEEHYRWDGRRFALVESRARDGGSASVDPGPFPVVAPEARRCRALLEVLDSSRARLLTYHGPRRSQHELVLRDPACAGSGDTVECGVEPSDPAASYTVVARGSDWVVLRVRSADLSEREVLRVPRRCAL